MIRADWATPPDGDFARYVDQLMARAAQARLQASTTPVEGFDGAPHGSGAAPTGPRLHRVGALDGSPGRTPRDEPRFVPADAIGWLQQRVRSAIATVPPAAGGSPRLYDPRVDRQPRKS